MENWTLRRDDGFEISTDKTWLDVPMIHQFLSNESYWATGISIENVQKTIDHSLCFGLYFQEKQVGFCRVVTDFYRFAYLADVFVLNEFRGKNLGKFIVEATLAHPDLQKINRWMLGTKDAHGLYEQFGYGPLPEPSRFMVKDNNPGC